MRADTSFHIVEHVKDLREHAIGHGKNCLQPLVHFLLQMYYRYKIRLGISSRFRKLAKNQIVSREATATVSYRYKNN